MRYSFTSVKTYMVLLPLIILVLQSIPRLPFVLPCFSNAFYHIYSYQMWFNIVAQFLAAQINCEHSCCSFCTRRGKLTFFEYAQFPKARIYSIHLAFIFIFNAMKVEKETKDKRNCYYFIHGIAL